MDKIIFFLEIKFYFFPAFRKNYRRRVRKSTNKKIWPNTAYLQMAYFKKNYNFPRFQGGRGGATFSRGWVKLLIAMETYETCEFSRRVQTSCPPPHLDPHMTLLTKIGQSTGTEIHHDLEISICDPLK